jgi:hypothetical protein
MNNIFRLNPGDLHVYSNMNVMGNTTPAGVEQPATVYFYKHSMPPASVKKGCFVSFREIEQVNHSHRLKRKKKEK